MGLPIFIRAFQKVKRVLDCCIFKSNLFDSNNVDGKKYLKKILEDISPVV